MRRQSAFFALFLGVCSGLSALEVHALVPNARPEAPQTAEVIYVQTARSRTSTTPSRTPLSTREMATQVRDSTNRNRVTVPTGPRTSVNYDLGGRSHYDKATGQSVPTPHKNTTTLHTGPTGSSGTTSRVEPMTKNDVRTVRRVIERRNNQ
jgi:hypothetical protein